VCCTVRTKGKKPGQSGQRISRDEVQRTQQKIIPVGNMVVSVVCCAGKGASQDSEDRQTNRKKYKQRTGEGIQESR
jgi:hypothetical protein